MIHTATLEFVAGDLPMVIETIDSPKYVEELPDPDPNGWLASIK